MSVSTTIDSTLGVVSTDVAGAGSVTLGAVRQQVTALTAETTMSLQQAGVVTISGTGALKMVMPTAASCPGSMFIFRTLSAHAHILSASQESNGTKAFTDGDANGSRITFGAAVGNSLAMVSDGVSFLLLQKSGSFTLAGT